MTASFANRTAPDQPKHVGPLGAGPNGCFSRPWVRRSEWGSTDRASALAKTPQPRGASAVSRRGFEGDNPLYLCGCMHRRKTILSTIRACTQTYLKGSFVCKATHSP